MAIRSAEQFKKDAHRGVLHHKSESLKTVTDGLEAYHQPTGDKQLKLIALHNAITDWRWWDPHEFRDRHGNDLQKEVERELGSKIPTKGLEDGDILFRYVTRAGGANILNPLVGERGPIQGLITMGQGLQELQAGVGKGASFDLIQHVGIYENGFVIEIGGTGLEHNIVKLRGCTDVVVRTQFGKQIASKARNAQESLLQKFYPIHDLGTLAFRPGSGGVCEGKAQNQLTKLNRTHREMGNRMQQRVVCSHFVHAVLYAAIQGGTLRTATDHSVDEIFMIGPSHLWGQFRRGQGVWATAGAKCVGVQKDGVLYPLSDPDRIFI